MCERDAILVTVIALFLSPLLLPTAALSYSDVGLPEDNLRVSKESVDRSQSNLSLYFEENWNFDDISLKKYHPEQIKVRKTGGEQWKLFLSEETREEIPTNRSVDFNVYYNLNYSIYPEYRFTVRKDSSPDGLEIVNSSREKPELLVDLEDKERNRDFLTWLLGTLGLKEKEEPEEIKIKLVWGGADGDNPFLEREKEESSSYTVTHRLNVAGQDFNCPESSRFDVLYQCSVPSYKLEDRFSIKANFSVNATAYGRTGEVTFR